MKVMKSLFLAVACLTGLSASAASIQWTTEITAVRSPSDSAAYAQGAIVYLISTTESTALSDAQATLAALTAGTWDSSTAYSSATTDEYGYVAPVTLTDDSLVSSTRYYFYTVTLYTEDGTSYAMVGSADSAIAGANDSGTPIGLISYSQSELEGVSNGWVKLNTVPEPTVLALLALGVAGVALKRRA